MKLLFLDESGDHNLTVIDPQYPVFVLGGLIVDKEYAEGEMAAHVRDFKLSLFGRDDLILRTADIARNRNGFERLKDTSFRQQFLEQLNALMQSLEYQVVACAIKKDTHLARYGAAAEDPYMLSLHVLVERFCFEIGPSAKQGVIIAEKRSPVLDRALDRAWTELTAAGTRYMLGERIGQRITGLTTKRKQENIAGLQLADLIVSPIGRFVLGKPMKDDFRIIESKFRRQNGDYHGFGLVQLPKLSE